MAKGIRGAEARYGWLFTAPAIIIIGVFLVLPILLHNFGNSISLLI